ncbi:MAG: hypothetical protein K6G88_00315 [Lachnospiraceae bacterium]|nr:hypothetical protein [Lachnospiraceae bacterium]
MYCLGKETTVPVRVVESNVESISFEMNNTLSEYMDGGINNGIFMYYSVPYMEGNKLIINYKDKTSEVYTYGIVPNTTYYAFVTEDGKELTGNPTWDIKDNAKPWSVGSDNEMVIKFRGKETTVPVTINTRKRTKIGEIKLGEEVEVPGKDASELKYYTFTPNKDGVYTFESLGAKYTRGHLFDKDFKPLASGTEKTSSFVDFTLQYKMKAGETYILYAYDYYSGNGVKVTVKETALDEKPVDNNKQTDEQKNGNDNQKQNDIKPSDSGNNTSNNSVNNSGADSAKTSVEQQKATFIKNCGKASVKSVTKKSNSKKIKITLKKKLTVAEGYDIRIYSKKSNAKKNKKAIVSITVKNKKSFTVSNSKLKNKKSLYIRMRGYKTISGKKVYSSKWSDIKKITVK